MVKPNQVLPPFRIILQARTTSSRLPAKVLLPVGGHPLSVLAALRAQRNGADVIVAIPDQPEDHLLAQQLIDAGLNICRGPLEDVLGRFLLATKDLDEDAICVRMTCDNPLPDADFVEEVIAHYVASGARYLAYGNDGQWLPYGLSAEVFRVSDLRAAAVQYPNDGYIREHVTPSIRRAYATTARPAFSNWPLDLGHLRCTVDTLTDYLRIAPLFAETSDPIALSWRDLVGQLKVNDTKLSSSMILGTVQLGMPYGMTKDQGLMPDTEAQEILRSAIELGCGGLDTARAYGESEARIGHLSKSQSINIPVITKLAPLDNAAGPAEAEASILTSMDALGTTELDTLLLHRAEHLKAADGKIWNKLRDFQRGGKIKTLGVSVQTPQELDRILARGDVHHIQLPFNLLDWRWASHIAGLRARPDIKVHVRSAFLQGLISQNKPEQWPELEHVYPEAYLSALNDLATTLGRKSLADLCLAYVRAFSWIDGIVLGVDSKKQLQEISDLFKCPALTWEEIARVQSSLPQAPIQLLNPALWPSTQEQARAKTTPDLQLSKPFTIWRDPSVMSSFPSIVDTINGPLLAFRIAPREPHDFTLQIGHQQHLHPRSSLATTLLDDRLIAKSYSLFPTDLFAADQDPNLMRLSNGELLMSSFSWRPQAFGLVPNEAPGFFHEKPSGMTSLFWGAFTSLSSDDGKTWSPRIYLPGLPGYPDLIEGSRPWHGGRHRGQAVETRDGRLLIGTYDRVDDASNFECFLYESTNLGQSWSYAGILAQDNSVGFAEPTLYRLANDDIIALHRTFKAEGKLAITRSSDNGETWSRPELSHIEGHPFFVVTLNTNWAVVLYALRGKASSIKVCLMNRYTGEFEKTEVTLQHGAPTQDIGYPTGMVLKDGRILVCYYWVDETGTRLLEGVTLQTSTTQ